MLKRAVTAIIEDESYHLPVEPAATALKVAEAVLAASEQPAFTAFEKKLLAALNAVVAESHSLSLKTKRVRYWRNYHQLRINSSFHILWSEFLHLKLGLKPEPVFFQDASERVFEMLIKEKLPLAVPQGAGATLTDPESLTSEELNALRYVAGYVLRKILAASREVSEEGKSFLESCVLDRDSKKEDLLGSNEWTQSCDRGGLVHVTDATFLLFVAMEDEARLHYTTCNMHQMSAGFKDMVASAIIANEEVTCQWNLMTAAKQLNSKEAQSILSKIIEKWVTIRGFSFASSVIELYKQQKFKTLEKSKALRKTV